MASLIHCNMDKKLTRGEVTYDLQRETTHAEDRRKNPNIQILSLSSNLFVETAVPSGNFATVLPVAQAEACDRRDENASLGSLWTLPDDDDAAGPCQLAIFESSECA